MEKQTEKYAGGSEKRKATRLESYWRSSARHSRSSSGAERVHGEFCGAIEGRGGALEGGESLGEGRAHGGATGRIGVKGRKGGRGGERKVERHSHRAAAAAAGTQCNLRKRMGNSELPEKQQQTARSRAEQVKEGRKEGKIRRNRNGDDGTSEGRKEGPAAAASAVTSL